MNYLFSDRFGGISKPPFDTLNLALHVEDNFDDVMQNRAILSKKLRTKNLVFMEQVHGANVEIIVKAKSQTIPKCDAMITDIRDVALCVMVADCIPVLLYDEDKEVIAVAHAGRNGVKLKIVNKTVGLMRDNFSCDIKDIKIIFGASIKSCCYEVKRDAIEGFKNYLHVEDDRIYLDIVSKCVDDLKDMGIKEQNIEVSSVCTCCDRDYFSYRRDGQTGRFCGAIVL